MAYSFGIFCMAEQAPSSREGKCRRKIKEYVLNDKLTQIEQPECRLYERRMDDDSFLLDEESKTGID